MRIIALEVHGNTLKAVEWVNKHSLANVFVNVTSDGYMSTVVFKLPTYQDYVHFCEKLDIEPISTKEYFF